MKEQTENLTNTEYRLNTDGVLLQIYYIFLGKTQDKVAAWIKKAATSYTIELYYPMAASIAKPSGIFLFEALHCFQNFYCHLTYVCLTMVMFMT